MQSNAVQFNSIQFNSIQAYGPGAKRPGVLIGDVGGQKSLRTYWKNYFEKTDTLIWVVDATDQERMEDCRAELMGLLQEEAGYNDALLPHYNTIHTSLKQSTQTLLKADCLFLSVDV